MFCTHFSSLLLEAPGWLLRQVAGSDEITLLRHRDALGDTLMVTALARGLKKWKPSLRVSVLSRRTDVFENNPHIDQVRGWHLWRTRGTVQGGYKRSELAASGHVIEIQWQNLFRELKEANHPCWDGNELPPLSGFHPELFLTEDEWAKGRALAGQNKAPDDKRPLILISSGGKLKPTHNREWGIENYQTVVDLLAPHARMYQIGGDDLLKVDGKPLPDYGRLPVREAAALFKHSDALLIQEGGLMHMARAVDAPTVALYGGYVHPEKTGYLDQVNLCEKPECSPCIVQAENCAHLKCMLTITPRRVLTCIAKLIEERSGYRLPPEILEKAPDAWTPPSFVDRDALKKEMERDE